MRGTNGGSRNTMPFCIVPDLGQRPENSVQPSSKQRCHVLQHNRSGLQFSNQANGFKEQSRPFPVQSCPSSGIGNILTGETSDDAIDSLKVACVAFSDVSLAVDFRPMLFEDLRRVVVDFDLPSTFKTGSLESKVEPSNTCK
jgi:hypothetical protein